MSIEKIISRIIEDASKEADLIIKQAEAEYESNLREAREEAEAIKQEIIDGAKSQAEAIARQISSRIDIERKKAISAARAQILGDIYKGVEQEILRLPGERLERLITALIAATDARGDEEIRFSESIKKIATRAFVNRLNKILGTSFSFSKESSKDALVELRSKNYRLLADIQTILKEHMSVLEEKVLQILGGKCA